MPQVDREGAAVMAWFAGGGFVAVVLAGIVAEAAVLVVLFRRTGAGVAPSALLPNLGAGACLVAASGAALAGAWWGFVGALLFAGGALHAIDLRARWRPRTG